MLMIEERNPNLDLLMLTVDKLGALTEKMVFVGGCATGLLVTDKAAPTVRETNDVDVIVEVGGYVDYSRLSKKLRQAGFREDQSDGAPLCRWIADGIVLDVMPTDESILGFSNQWYKIAMQKAEKKTLPNNISINVVTAPYFIATKIEAFEGRGRGDYLLSHDLEDLVSVVNGRPELLEEVRQADSKLRKSITGKFRAFLDNPRFVEALPGKIPGDAGNQARIPLIEKRMQEIAELD